MFVRSELIKGIHRLRWIIVYIILFIRCSYLWPFPHCFNPKYSIMKFPWECYIISGRVVQRWREPLKNRKAYSFIHLRVTLTTHLWICCFHALNFEEMTISPENSFRGLHLQLPAPLRFEQQTTYCQRDWVQICIYGLSTLRFYRNVKLCHFRDILHANVKKLAYGFSYLCLHKCVAIAHRCFTTSSFCKQKNTIIRCSYHHNTNKHDKL